MSFPSLVQLSCEERAFLRQFVEEIGRNLEPLIFASEYFDEVALGESVETRIRFYKFVWDYKDTLNNLRDCIGNLFDTFPQLIGQSSVLIHLISNIGYDWLDHSHRITDFAYAPDRGMKEMSVADQNTYHQKVYLIILQFVNDVIVLRSELNSSV